MLYTQPLCADTPKYQDRRDVAAKPSLGDAVSVGVTAALVYGFSRPSSFGVTPLNGCSIDDVTQAVELVRPTANRAILES